MKCKKIQPIPVDMVIDFGAEIEVDIEIDTPKIISDVDEFFISKKSNNISHHHIADYMNNVDKSSNLILKLYGFTRNILTSSVVFKNLNNINNINNTHTTTKWISYS